MKTAAVLVVFLLNYVENHVLPLEFIEPKDEAATFYTNDNSGSIDDTNQHEPMELTDNVFDKYILSDSSNQPCTVVVLSNSQIPNAQTLVRKYTYDSNGILIPSSVKYFIKMAPEGKSSPVLIPLNDKAFTPLGGFIRYYKEVPPIPQTSW